MKDKDTPTSKRSGCLTTLIVAGILLLLFTFVIFYLGFENYRN